jgi:cell division septation protein DedD
MATPSLSLVESLIGAIPIEEGAALVARVGERATITAKSGSIEVGSVALTVEAMDDLIGQVLPPDQLEALQENGTVHFEFTPPVVGGDFAVLAASTPGDRWLEIRRRSTVMTAPPPPPVEPAAAAPAPSAPVPAATPLGANEADVAELLSRFQAPETMSAKAPAPAVPRPAAPPPPPPPPPPTPQASVQAASPDFDLSTTVPNRPPVEPPPVPIVDAGPVNDAPVNDVNDDLAVPNLDFLPATTDFDLDGLTLSGDLPDPAGPPAAPATFDESDDSDRDTHREEIPRMGKSFASTPYAEDSNRRVFVLVGALVGIAVLAAGYWFVLPRFLAPKPAPVAAAPPPRPRPPAKAPVAPKPAAAAPAAQAKASTPAAAHPASVGPEPSTVVPAKAASAPPAVTKASTPAKPVQRAAEIVEQARSGFAVQVAAVRERDEADRIVARLVNEGYPGYLVRGQGAAAAFYRVRVGAFKDRQAAEEAASRLERAEGVKPWIVREN